MPESCSKAAVMFSGRASSCSHSFGTGVAMQMRRAVSNILDDASEVVASREIIDLCDGEKLALAKALAKGVSEREATPIVVVRRPRFEEVE